MFMPITAPAPQPQTAHQLMTGVSAEAVQQQTAPAGPLSAAGAEVAARLQRIEALAAEIARAQVRLLCSTSSDVLHHATLSMMQSFCIVHRVAWYDGSKGS